MRSFAECYKLSRRSLKNKNRREYRVFFVSYYIRKYLIGIQRGAVFFFFSKVFEPKKYLYIYIYTHVIKKKKKNNLFRFGTEADFFAFAGTGLYFDTSRREGARDPQTRVFARVIIRARVCVTL